MILSALERFVVVALTHKNLPLELIGRFHIGEEKREELLRSFKEQLGLEELMYLSTCNRVEFVLVQNTTSEFHTDKLLEVFGSDLSPEEKERCAAAAEVYHGDVAVHHLFKLSSSLESMVIGEREIITQVRNSYEECHKMGLTGDLIRLVVRKTIETAKKIFTETNIFKKPVSVVALAFHELKNQGINPKNSRILLVGAGKTNRAMARFLRKYGCKNVAVFNRTKAKALALAEEINANAYALDDLQSYSSGFDVLIACTGASSGIITSNLYKKLLNGDTDRKILVDLAIPADIDSSIPDNFPAKYIGIEQLRIVADQNLGERQKEIARCEKIIGEMLLEFHDLYRTRQVELAMGEIPRKVKEIHQMALETVFAKDIQGLDNQSREVLNRVMAYVEKKYISMPMKMAREVILKQK